jgi:hypothetical protein
MRRRGGLCSLLESSPTLCPSPLPGSKALVAELEQVDFSGDLSKGGMRSMESALRTEARGEQGVVCR